MHRFHLENHLLNKDIEELYAFHIIRTFALSMVAIFLPIFLWERGFSLSLIFLFYGILVATHTVFIPFSTLLTRKIGIKHTLALSTPILFLFYFLLPLLTSSPLTGLFFALPIIHGLHNAFFWTGNHLLFIRRGIARKIGREMGYLTIINGIIASMGPLIGGILILLFGFNPIFLMASVLILISLIPLLADSDIKEPAHLPYKRSVPHPNKMRKRLAYAGRGIVSIGDGFAWPLILFFAVANIRDFGTLISMGSLASLALLLWASKRFDTNQHAKIFHISSLWSSFVVFLRTISSGIFFIAGIEILGRMSRPLVVTSFDTENFNDARKHSIHFFKEREMTINAVACLLFFLFAMFPNLLAAVAVGIIGYLLASLYK